MPRISWTSLRKPVLRSKPIGKKILKPYSNTRIARAVERVSQLRVELTHLLKGSSHERFVAIERLGNMYENGKIDKKEIFPHLAKIIFSDKSATNRLQAAYVLKDMNYQPALKLFKRVMDPIREENSEVKIVAIEALVKMSTNEQERKELLAFFEKAHEKEPDPIVKSAIDYYLDRLR